MLKEEFLSYEGRLSRRLFVIDLLAISIFSGLVNAAAWSLSTMPEASLMVSVVMVLTGLLSLAAYLSVYARRWHDVGRSGWFAAALLVPAINVIALVYLLAKPGQAEGNAYGEAA